MQLNPEMLPKTIEHIDKWFTWDGYGQDLGDKSVSILAFNLQPFYEYCCTFLTEKQKRQMKEDKFADSFRMFGVFPWRDVMNKKTNVKSPKEMYMLVNGEYKVDLENESLILNNGFIMTKDYFKTVISPLIQTQKT